MNLESINQPEVDVKIDTLIENDNTLISKESIDEILEVCDPQLMIKTTPIESENFANSIDVEMKDIEIEKPPEIDRTYWIGREVAVTLPIKKYRGLYLSVHIIDITTNSQYKLLLVIMSDL